MLARYSFKRGATITLAIDVLDNGDPGIASGLVAHLRQLQPDIQTPLSTSSLVASFTVTSRAAAAPNPAGWNLTIAAATSAGIPAGRYYADLLMVIAGGTVITDGVEVEIVEPATVLP